MQLAIPGYALLQYEKQTFSIMLITVKLISGHKHFLRIPSIYTITSRSYAAKNTTYPTLSILFWENDLIQRGAAFIALLRALSLSFSTKSCLKESNNNQDGHNQFG